MMKYFILNSIITALFASSGIIAQVTIVLPLDVRVDGIDLEGGLNLEDPRHNLAALGRIYIPQEGHQEIIDSLLQPYLYTLMQKSSNLKLFDSNRHSPNQIEQYKIFARDFSSLKNMGIAKLVISDIVEGMGAKYARIANQLASEYNADQVLFVLVDIAHKLNEKDIETVRSGQEVKTLKGNVYVQATLISLDNPKRLDYSKSKRMISPTLGMSNKVITIELVEELILKSIISIRKSL